MSIKQLNDVKVKKITKEQLLREKIHNEIALGEHYNDDYLKE